LARPKKINATPVKKSTREQRILKAQELALLERQLEIKECLPHLYGLRWYTWQWNFFVSRHKVNLLTSANQVGKSSCQIRKAIDWATDVKKWPELWPHSTPRQFWYFYPSSDLVTTEVETKWIPEFLPRGKFKDHSVYGWRIEYEKKKVHSIVFNSGVTIYFKSYEQKLKNLQGSSCHAVFVDEELPEDFVPEIMARLGAATIQGYFHSVFTATIGQEFWRLAMEPGENEKENFPDAFKQQVGLYDCMTYKDGTPGPWTEEMIQARIKSCVDEGEVQRRVFGKFVSKHGRAYPTYIPDRHFIKPHPIDLEWKIYSAIDNGSGKGAHPAGIVFIAVRPDFQYGVVFKCWRGDDVVTTAGDVIQKWKEMGAGLHITQSWYDHEAKDLKTIADRQGENLNPADKSRDKGQQILNTLFKNDMLKIFDDEDGQGAKLGGELIGLKENTNKSKAKDDLIDPTRYCVIGIPWDWSVIAKNLTEEEVLIGKIKATPPTEKELLEQQIRERRGIVPRSEEPWSEFYAEFDEWNEMYG
jgi:hypothetical protein